MPIPEQAHFRADRAAITLRAFELKTDPLVLGSHVVLVDEQRSSLICNHDIEHATIPEIDKRDRTPVKNITRSDRLRHVYKLPRAVVKPNSFLLVTGQAATVHRRPVRRIRNDRRVAAGDLREVVPVVLIAIGGNVTVHEIEIERAVVIEITKLSTKTPAADFDVHRAREIVVFESIAAGTFARHPKVVALDQDAFFGNIRNVDRVAALVEYVSDGCIHAALR